MSNGNENTVAYEIGDGITATDAPQAVTIKIEGRALENLRRLAEVYGAWDGLPDLTPAELIARYFGDDQALATLARKDQPKEVDSLAGKIVSMHEDADDADALEADFVAAGFAVNY